MEAQYRFQSWKGQGASRAVMESKGLETDGFGGGWREARASFDRSDDASLIATPKKSELRTSGDGRR